MGFGALTILGHNATITWLYGSRSLELYDCSFGLLQLVVLVTELSALHVNQIVPFGQVIPDVCVSLFGPSHLLV